MAMALSALETTSTRTRVPHPVCPHCGRCVNLRPRRSFIEPVLTVLAGLALAIILAPPAVIVWKSCADFLSDRASHSIFFHPLEDWTQY
jgi:hypothetical protein